jgi:pilus assembly protein CpaD
MAKTTSQIVFVPNKEMDIVKGVDLMSCCPHPIEFRRGKTLRSGTLRAAALLAGGLALAGCSSLRPTQQAFAPDEYDQRHPIKIANGVDHLDIFDTGRGLDRRQQRDILEFAREYSQNGRGPMTLAAPSGGSRQLGLVRSVLAQAGIRGAVHITHYQVDPMKGASPVRLSFTRLKAVVGSQCGLWPADLAGSKDLETWHNRPYHNLGCSHQSMLAAQVADPVDFVRPRFEGPVDPAKRTKDIEALRKDQDPSTNWRKDDAKIKEAQQ